MKNIKNIISAFLTVLIVVFSAFTTVAATTSATLSGPEILTLEGNLEVAIELNGSGEKAVSGQIKYDPVLLVLEEVKAAKDGWKLEYNIAENGDLCYFTVADVSNKNPVTGNQAVVTFVFSKKFLEIGSKPMITASDLKASSGSGTVSMSDCSYHKTVTVPVANDGGNDEEESDVIITTVDGGDPYDEIRLASLSVAEAELSPEFEPDTKNYQITVPASLKEITVTAVAKNPESTVTITDTELKYSEKNITKIVVEGKSGSKRTYKIYTYKNAESQSDKNADKQNKVLIIVGIIIGAVLLVLLIGITIFIILKKKDKRSISNL